MNLNALEWFDYISKNIIKIILICNNYPRFINKPFKNLENKCFFY